ncbi:MAG TPA: Crp/Fnr family transcriptional regulator [Pyrinomonadaceae bacterium]|nr:Crp/Fnr family transcriptional regulator [Pyrinomonadaceae bacterium]
MLSALTQSAASGNQILAGLPREKYSDLFSHLKPVSLKANKVLYNVEDKIQSAYFINSGVASLISLTADGNSIEIGNVGNEGMIGVPVLLRQGKTPHQIVMQVPGEALEVSADVLREEFEKEGELKNRLLSYTHALATYMSQLSVCNHFHTIEKRLCRWLLITSEQLQSITFRLTHETLSQVLGTARTGITMAANKLQRDKLIRYHRGQITILDREGLEELSCDCYQSNREVLDHTRM